MKAFFHVCMTARSEVLLRSVEDVAMMTNYSAVAARRCDVEILADSQMSNHFHEAVMGEDAARFAWSQELSLTKAFNSRHSRRGPLFDGRPYILQIQGPHHTQMCLTYSLRQGSHHGQSETPFDYPWSTCNQLFTNERGVHPPAARYGGRSELRELLPKNFSDFPDDWQADENGILLRRSFEQLSLVENWYGTARSFMFSMLRRSSEEWLAEQDKDGIDCPKVTLELIENGFSAEEISSMLMNEGNSKFLSRGMPDMEVCELIDNQMIGRFGVDSVYLLSKGQKEKLADELRHDVGVRSEKQIARCLVMAYDR